MHILIAIVVIICAVPLWLWVAGWTLRRELYAKALAAEASSQFEDAIYYYGEALANYYSPPEVCRKKIIELWKLHGPFQFAKHRAEISKSTNIGLDGDLTLFNQTVRIIGEVAGGKIERRDCEPYKDTGRTGIYLEMPDKNNRIYDPSVEDVLRELKEISFSPNNDSCIDIFRSEDTFMQAIAGEKPGFFIWFKAPGGKVYQSQQQLPTSVVQELLKTYLISGMCPENLTGYNEVKKGEE